MIKIENKKRCSGCTACYSVCPTKAIEMFEDKEGFLYPKVDEKKCIECGLCTKACPCIEKSTSIDFATSAYAVINNDIKERLVSSSGGMFYILAKKVVSSGGVVFGAKFLEDFTIAHTKIDREEDIKLLIGSKYMQSKMNNSFSQVKEILLEDRKVLFVGTSCQIAGLKKYLFKSYENLYTIDLICKSVPSPLIWKKYLRSFYNNETIKFVNFKDKTKGWNKFCVKIITDKKEYLTVGRDDYYMQGFFKSLYNRPSCSACNFRFPHRDSDMTLADCWGIEEMASELNDNLGASTVIINSVKGKFLFESIKSQINYMEVKIDDVINHNPYLQKTEKYHKARSLFWFFNKILPFKLVLRLMAYPYKEKTMNLLRQMYYKVRRKK